MIVAKYNASPNLGTLSKSIKKGLASTKARGS